MTSNPNDKKPPHEREKATDTHNLVPRVKFSLLDAGFDIHSLDIDLLPTVVIVIKPTRFLEGEIWNRLTEFLRKRGFHWYREDGAWKKGMMNP